MPDGPTHRHSRAGGNPAGLCKRYGVRDATHCLDSRLRGNDVFTDLAVLYVE